MGVELTEEIDGLRQRIRLLQIELESLVPDFVAVASAHVVDWSAKAARQAAEALIHSQHGRETGFGGRVAKLREDVDARLTQIPALVRQELNRDYYWPHRGRDFSSGDDQQPVWNALNSFWTYAGAKLYGFIGLPLVKHEFVEPSAANAPWLHDNAIDTESLSYRPKARRSGLPQRRFVLLSLHI